MAIRILKEGKLPESLAWPKKITCKTCNSELEYQKVDVKDGSDPRESYSEYYITCPFCKQSVTLKAGQH